MMLQQQQQQHQQQQLRIPSPLNSGKLNLRLQVIGTNYKKSTILMMHNIRG
jgi:hypothetical protein